MNPLVARLAIDPQQSIETGVVPAAEMISCQVLVQVFGEDGRLVSDGRYAIRPNKTIIHQFEYLGDAAAGLPAGFRAVVYLDDTTCDNRKVLVSGEVRESRRGVRLFSMPPTRYRALSCP